MNEALNPRGDDNERWQALIRESEATIEKYLVPTIDIDLASFIRCVTFRAFLVVFLNVDPDTLAFGNVERVTAFLSDFYNDRQARIILPADLESILHAWLPDKRYPSVLDRILPAYEALWRIVATIVVTCEDDETRVLRWVMLDFRDNPRDRQYSASFSSGKSASAITNDAVGRLRPIARPQQATASNSLLSCIQHVFSGTSSAERRPTVVEALKFAALLASKVIGRVGAQYEISAQGITDYRASPWEQRRLCGIFGASAGPADAAEMPPPASTSRQMHNH